MSASDRRRVLARLAVGLWLLLGLLLWNGLFDLGIRTAARDYLERQQRHLDGGGAPIAIDDVMGPAAGASARRASVVAGAVAGGGLLLTWLGLRRSGRP